MNDVNIIENIDSLPKLVSQLDKQVPLQRVVTPWLDAANVTLDLLRIDQLDPQISGNKWYKLKYNILHAHHQGKKIIISFGGAWSNHIHALASAGQRLGVRTIGVIRGERAEKLSATLLDAEQLGMQLHFVNRADYRRKHEKDFQRALLKALSLSSDEVHFVPEGGSNRFGVLGCRKILKAASFGANAYDEIWAASGTGSTIAGIAWYAKRHLPNTKVNGVAVLKGASFLRADIAQFMDESLTGELSPNWQLWTEFHHGGYGKVTPELLTLIKDFKQQTGVQLDPVYTGKVLFALKQRVQLHNVSSNDVPSSSTRILMVHTGGIQGCRGFNL